MTWQVAVINPKPIVGFRDWIETMYENMPEGALVLVSKHELSDTYDLAEFEECFAEKDTEDHMGVWCCHPDCFTIIGEL